MEEDGLKGDSHARGGWRSRGSGRHGGNKETAVAHRLLLVAAVMVPVLLVAGVGVWLARSAVDVPGGSGTGDDTTSDAGGQTWSRVALGETEVDAFGGQLMSSVVAGGPGLVAVGTGAFGPDGVAAVWTSPDGHTWSRVAHDEAVFGGPGRQAMHSVAAGGPGLVAVGEDTGQAAAAVWTSPDGHTWSRVAHDEAVFGGSTGPTGPTGPGGPTEPTGPGGPGGPGLGVAMRSVAAGGPGLVAVGEDTGQGAAAVWTSPDGHTWSRVAHDEAVFGGSTGPGGPGVAMSSVVAGGPGLVAVGSAIDAEAFTVTAAVWTSPDGHTWSRVSDDEAVFGGPGGPIIASVTAGGPGLVAVGELHSRGAAAVWTSPDGQTWSRVSDDEAVFASPREQQKMNSVVAGGPGLVAVGTSGIGPQAPVAAVWTSPDGQTWSRVSDDEAVFGGSDGAMMWSVAAGGPRLVAVGTDGAPDPAPAVWVSE